MRPHWILLIVAGAGLALWYALERGAVSRGVDAGMAPVTVQSDARLERPAPRAQPAPPIAAQPIVPAETGVEPAALAPEPRGIAGLVIDRFGQPMRDERVFLLPAGQEHPPEGASLAQHFTARTDDEGRFLLELPHAGDWRLSVGPAGRALMPPSAPRALTHGGRVELVVPGRAAVSVRFETALEGVERASLQLLALSVPPKREEVIAPPPVERMLPHERREMRDDAGGDAGSDALTTPSAGRRIQREGGVSGRGSERIEVAEASGDEGKLPGTSTLEVPTKVYTPPPPPPPPPPQEIWHTLRTLDFRVEELSAGPLLMSGLPVDRTARLDLRVERERAEGRARLSLVADALTEVRVLAIGTGPDASLTYVATARPLPAHERPAGIHWLD